MLKKVLALSAVISLCAVSLVVARAATTLPDTPPTGVFDGQALHDCPDEAIKNSDNTRTLYPGGGADQQIWSLNTGAFQSGQSDWTIVVEAKIADQGDDGTTADDTIVWAIDPKVSYRTETGEGNGDRGDYRAEFTAKQTRDAVAAADDSGYAKFYEVITPDVYENHDYINIENRIAYYPSNNTMQIQIKSISVEKGNTTPSESTDTTTVAGDTTATAVDTTTTVAETTTTSAPEIAPIYTWVGDTLKNTAGFATKNDDGTRTMNNAGGSNQQIWGVETPAPFASNQKTFTIVVEAKIAADTDTADDTPVWSIDPKFRLFSSTQESDSTKIGETADQPVIFTAKQVREAVAALPTGEEYAKFYMVVTPEMYQAAPYVKWENRLTYYPDDTSNFMEIQVKSISVYDQNVAPVTETTTTVTEATTTTAGAAATTTTKAAATTTTKAGTTTTTKSVGNVQTGDTAPIAVMTLLALSAAAAVAAARKIRK